MTLRPVGDVELWYADGEGGAWRLPFHVEWKSHPQTGQLFALVLPGVVLYEMQLLAIRTLFSGYALDSADDRWLIPKDTLPTKLTKAPGINAAFYYHWPSGVHPPIPAVYHPTNVASGPPARADQFKDFASYISKERGIPADIVLLVLRAISQLGSRWMIERREPLDLGFVKLGALPFRSNWKEIVAYKLRPFPLSKILAAGKAMRLRMLETIGFPKTVCSTHNIGLRVKSRDKFRLNYTVEAVTTPQFEAVVEQVERDRMKTSQTSYVAQFEWTVRKTYAFIIEAMAQFIRKSSCSWAAVHVSRVTGNLTFFPRGRHTGKLGLNGRLDRIPVHIVPPESDFSVFAENPGASDPTLLYPEAPHLQPLSAVPPAADDLRQREVNGQLGEPRQNGAARVSLLDAGQGAGSTGDVLPGGSTAGRESPRLEEA